MINILPLYRFSVVIVSFFPLAIFLLVGACSPLPVTDQHTEHALKLLSKAKKISSPERAIQTLHQALAYDSTLSEIYLELSNRYNETSNDLDALNILNKAIQHNAGNPEIYFKLGCLYMELKDYPQSAKSFEQVPETNHLFYFALFKRAQIYYLLENYDLSALMIEQFKNQDSFFLRPETQWMMERLSTMGYLTTKNSSSSDHDITRLLTRYALAQLACNYFHFTSSSDIFFVDIPNNDPRYEIAAAAVANNFLDKLPDRKFYPDYPITRRNLAWILYQWAKKNQPSSLTLPPSYPVWKDLSINDPHYTILLTTYHLQWIAPENSSVFGADSPIKIKDAIAGFEKFLRDSENHKK